MTFLILICYHVLLYIKYVYILVTVNQVLLQCPSATHIRTREYDQPYFQVKVVTGPGVWWHTRWQKCVQELICFTSIKRMAGMLYYVVIYAVFNDSWTFHH
jgi:hypothetical protein